MGAKHCHVCGDPVGADQPERRGFGGIFGPVCDECAADIDAGEPDGDGDGDPGDGFNDCCGCLDESCECGGIGPDFVGGDDDDGDE